MPRSPSPLLLASPAVAASFAVLAVAGVDRNLFCLACAVAAAGLKLSGWTESRSWPAVIVALVTPIGLAVPLCGSASPDRSAGRR